jgi:hypothetical protein
MTQGRLEAAGRAETFVGHAYPEQLVDLGEVRLNYATAGDQAPPPLLGLSPRRATTPAGDGVQPAHRRAGSQPGRLCSQPHHRS